MAGDDISETSDYPAMFNQAILVNLEYFLQLPAVQSLNAVKLDQERESLLRTIRFALHIRWAWPLVYRLIEAISPYMERRGYWAMWEQTLNQALQVAQENNETANGVTLSLLLARLLQRQSNLKAAVQYYRQTIYLARQCGDQFNEARACTNMGYLFIELGRWWRAEVLCRSALTIFERIGSQHGLAHTENHLGILYLRQHCWWGAQHHLERACAIWSTQGDTHGLMRGCINLGALYLELSSPIQARFYLIYALEQAKAASDEIEIATIYLSLCVACRIEHNPIRAEWYARQAETIFRRFHNNVGLAQAWDNLGLVSLDLAKWSEAERHFKAALQQWRNLKSKLGELRVLTYLVEYQLARQNRQQAATILSRVQTMLNSSVDARQYRFFQPKLNRYHYDLSRL